MNQTRICLWSGPRNISTALMYSFAQRKDTRVIDEPLYAHFLIQVSQAMHPGREEVIGSMEKNGEKVINNVILGPYSEKVIFMKQMTHHLVNLDHSFLTKVVNVFLIRDPLLLISSLAQILPAVTMRDTGLKTQFELFNEISDTGVTPVVIDSGEILKEPLSAITHLCYSIGIPFDKNMLKWKAGPRKEDGIWGKYWYKSVHKTTHFEKQGTNSRTLPQELQPLYEECLPYYNKLFKYSILT